MFSELRDDSFFIDVHDRAVEDHLATHDRVGDVVRTALVHERRLHVIHRRGVGS